MTPRKIRIIVGILIWVAAVAWVGYRYVPNWFGERSATTKSLLTFMFKPATERELQFEEISYARIGDPIFYRNDAGDMVQVGKIIQVESWDSQSYEIIATQWARARFFSSAPKLTATDYLTVHETPESMDWVAKFLFPPERRERIAGLVANVYAIHSQEILQGLLPILRDVWSEASLLIRDDLLAALERHQPEFAALGRKYESEIVESELIPLLGREIWPIVMQHGQPVLETVGAEIWQRASVFRLGWRAIYDASPLPTRNLTQAEFNRLVENDAIPVLEANLPRFIAAQQLVLQDIAQNPTIQSVLTGSLQQIIDDPEMQALIMQILREAILENAELNQFLAKVWERSDLQEVLALTDARLEPTVVSIGEEVFGSPYDGVTPEFARILRNKILLKDQRWFVLNRSPSNQPLNPDVAENQNPNVMIVLPGQSNLENPFYYPAKKR